MATASVATSRPSPPLILSSSSSSSSRRRHNSLHSFSLSFSPSPPLRIVISSANPRKTRSLTRVSSNSASSSSSSSSSFQDDIGSNSSIPSAADKKSMLSELIQEIEPLDVSLIQKDVPPTTLDAMKRTISGMLGLLPSDRFHVSIEALWEPLSKLLVSSMMTGYTLRNAEYRLCLERNIDIEEENADNCDTESCEVDVLGTVNSPIENQCSGNDIQSEKLTEDSADDNAVKGLGEIPLEAQQYILHLQSRLSSMKKVAELSEPTNAELKETIHSVVHGLLATLSPKMHYKSPPQSETTPSGTVNGDSEDFAELVENTSPPHFQAEISLTRDYLARLLFWCMLLGHYLRGLEYRMELMELLSLTNE
ncbi:hypothetical protein LINGRAHAP2_LOCUS35681 [Linum grandiflorum]